MMEPELIQYIFSSVFDNKFLLTVIIGLCVVILSLLWSRRPSNLPPGPIGLPLVGYLPFVGSEAYITFHQLTQKYGPVFSLYLGRKLVVILGNYDAMKEAYTNNDILDRPPNPPNHLLPDSSSMTISSGKEWKEQRDFSVQMLRNLGMGKSRMEEIIQEEIRHLIPLIHEKKGQPFNLDTLLVPSVSNNIYTLLAGHRLDFENKDRLLLNDLLSTMVMYFRPTRVHAYFPWLRKWLIRFKIWGYDKADIIMRNFGRFAEKLINEHSISLDKTCAADYIDGYLTSMTTKTNNNSTTFSKKMLKGNLQSFLGAGSTPPRAAIEWGLISMVKYPEIMHRLQKEIDSVVGKDRLPKWEDRKSMPFAMAVITEVLRYYTIIPISMLRYTSAECKIGGFSIPKGTIVVANLWGIHHNSDDWEHPNDFKPDRFLQDGKFIHPSRGYAPLSYGKRNCPGEELAYMEVFLYLTSILQSFCVSSTGEAKEKFEQKVGVAKLVIPDNICLTPRT